MTVQEYIDDLPVERKDAFLNIRQAIIENIPKGFEEVINYGMICFVVPHELYPSGYHCNPKDPLPFMSLASQKQSINLYHLGIYQDRPFKLEVRKLSGMKNFPRSSIAQ